MKTVIAYATKSGTTAKCAGILAEKLSSLGEIKLADLDKEKVNPDDYDLIILGGNVRMGNLAKKAVKFMKKNKNKLLQKKTAFYFCCGYPQTADLVIGNNYPYELINSCICVETFGGELNTDNLKPMDKKIADMVLSSPENKGKPKPCILENNIKLFAEKILDCVS